jgi:DNA-binding FadR family transcriptional regulator
VNERVDLREAILRIIAAHSGAIGQGAINLFLRKQGVLVSMPTVGRRLQELEFEGFVAKAGIEGRVLTDRGRHALKRFDAEARLRVSGDALLATLRRGDRQHLLALLAARRVIEAEAAALAATRVSPKAVAKMEGILSRQAAGIARGETGLEEDIAFHREIARASHNEVLCSLIMLLRQHRRYNLIVNSIRAAVGSRMVVDHARILAALKRHNPRAARAAMERHLRTLAADLNRYLSRWSSDGRTHGR